MQAHMRVDHARGTRHLHVYMAESAEARSRGVKPPHLLQCRAAPDARYQVAEGAIIRIGEEECLAPLAGVSHDAQVARDDLLVMREASVRVVPDGGAHSHPTKQCLLHMSQEKDSPQNAQPSKSQRNKNEIRQKTFKQP